jgi:phosphoglycolate phosphatase-like HAD superfamily hydrolase
LRAAWENDLTLASSWYVGDTLNDVEAGCRAGCRTVLIENGNEVEWRYSSFRVPTHKAADPVEAARLIVNSL